VADTVILNVQDIGQAQRATSAVLGAVLAEHSTTFDRWVVLNALATGAVPPERARFLPALSAALATAPAAVEVTIDQAEEAGLVRIVSGPGGETGAVRAELTPAGRARHETLRSAIDQVAGELYAGIPRARPRGRPSRSDRGHPARRRVDAGTVPPRVGCPRR
jgi:DNA-binding MarR family transcriptional regulator